MVKCSTALHRKKGYLGYIDEYSDSLPPEKASCAGTTNQTGSENTMKPGEHDGAQHFTTYSVS